MSEKPKIVICVGSSCFARGNDKNVAFVEKFLASHGLKDEVDCDLSGSLCSGDCANGPNVIVNGKMYSHVDAGVMKDILTGLFPEKKEA